MMLRPGEECFFRRLGVARASWRVHIQWARCEAQDLPQEDQLRIEEAFATLSHSGKRAIYVLCRDGLSRAQAMHWLPSRHWSLDVLVLVTRLAIFAIRLASKGLLQLKEKAATW